MKKSKDDDHHTDWVSVVQPPKQPFPFPVGASLEAQEEVILMLPKKVIADDEKIGDMIICNDDAQIALRDDLDAWLVKLQPGFRISVGRSCQMMVMADDSRPRRFRLRQPK